VLGQQGLVVTEERLRLLVVAVAVMAQMAGMLVVTVWVVCTGAALVETA
jgi:hypothetical protein